MCRCFPAGRKSGQQGLGTSRLPVFSPQEKNYIKGTCDFLGLGHFTTRYISQKNYPSGLGDSYFADRDLAELVDPQWPDPGSEWLYSVPWGFRRLLNFVKVKTANGKEIEMFSNLVAPLVRFCYYHVSTRISSCGEEGLVTCTAALHQVAVLTLTVLV